MRGLVFALAALAFATTAGAAPQHAQGPYTYDANGKCRSGNGHHVLQRLCHAPPTHPYCESGKQKRCGSECIPVGQDCHLWHKP
jgi:hypothetical protein